MTQRNKNTLAGFDTSFGHQVQKLRYGPLTLSGTLTVSGSTTMSGNLEVKHNVKIGTTAQTARFIVASPTLSGNTAHFSTATAAAPVSIGRNEATGSQVLNLAVDDSTAYFTHIQDESAANFRFSLITGSDGTSLLGVKEDIVWMVLDGAGPRVGIGRNPNSEILEVEGNIELNHTVFASASHLILSSSQGNVMISGTLRVSGSSHAISGTLSVSGSILVKHSDEGIGYQAGSGGTVSQSTAKSNPVTLNRPVGRINMAKGSGISGSAEVTFTVNNSVVDAADVIVANLASGGTSNAYSLSVTSVAAGSFAITISNLTAAALDESLVIQYAVIKGATA